MGIYVLDSSMLIQAHRFYYPIGIATGFWNKLKELAEKGNIISIDKVKKEIYNGNDELKDWCEENLQEGFFKDTAPVMTEYTQVTSWAVSRSGHYLPNALNEFLDADEADAFLVAFALADRTNRILVTQEISEPDRQNKVKIPDACIALNVQYVNTIDMFRQLGETF